MKNIASEDLEGEGVTEQKVYAFPNLVIPSTPVVFNSDICNGCNTCVDVCQVDVFLPSLEKGKPPIVLFPEECWYGGCCVVECPRPGAIRLNHPLTQRVRWKCKETSEHFRV